MRAPRRARSLAARRVLTLSFLLLLFARAGVGKTTCVTQLAAAYAEEHPDISVLVVDFSIHGDSTSQLLGAPRAR